MELLFFVYVHVYIMRRPEDNLGYQIQNFIFSELLLLSVHFERLSLCPGPGSVDQAGLGLRAACLCLLKARATSPGLRHVLLTMCVNSCVGLC